MTLPEILLICAAALCVICLLLIAMMTLSLYSKASPKAESALQDHEIARIATYLSERMGITDEGSIRTLTARVEEMRKDFDWLVSDRMIEQAIDMARLGQPTATIVQTTGISPDELATINKLRRH